VRLRQFLPALVLAWCAAELCAWFDTPLPWMIGPLFATAAACMLGAPLAAPVQAREAGQWAIGTTLGLYFTPQVVAVLGHEAGWLALSVIFALASGWLGGVALQRLSGVDRATAFFAMAVGSAAEMAVQAERHGARIDRVAAAHSLRIMLVVGIIPFALRAWSGHGLAAGLDLFVPAAQAVAAGPLLVLVALTAAGSMVLKRLRVPNAWVIGALLVAGSLTAAGIHLSRLPEPVVRAGQLCIGVALGTRFTPDFALSGQRDHLRTGHAGAGGRLWYCRRSGGRPAPRHHDPGYVAWRDCRDGIDSARAAPGRADRDRISCGAHAGGRFGNRAVIPLVWQFGLGLCFYSKAGTAMAFPASND
jgi:membrane AbrB-like protein